VIGLQITRADGKSPTMNSAFIDHGKIFVAYR